MSALIIVDVQNDFTQGSLALTAAPSAANVPQTIANINTLLSDNYFDTVVYTKDYHPPDHCSFKIWPVHCVAGTWGAELDPNLLEVPPKCGQYFTIKKGTSQSVDSYSAFVDNEGRAVTELQSKLSSNGISKVFVCGLALDYCVFHTAMDSRQCGFETFVVLDCTSAFETEDDEEYQEKMQKLADSGIVLIDSQHFKA